MNWWSSLKVTSKSESPSGSNLGRSTSSWKGRRHEIGECPFILWTYLVVYFGSGARVTVRPFFSVIALGAAHTWGILLYMAIYNERVDIGERRDLRLGRG